MQTEFLLGLLALAIVFHGAGPGAPFAGLCSPFRLRSAIPQVVRIFRYYNALNTASAVTWTSSG